VVAMAKVPLADEDHNPAPALLFPAEARHWADWRLSSPRAGVRHELPSPQSSERWTE
jgi:hypothetical protein